METWIGGQRVKEIYINGQQVQSLYKGGVKIYERAAPVAPAPNVVIGTQTWMSKNLGTAGLETPGYGRFYNNANQEYFAGAGKLYTWQEAVAVAALFPGWHLPTSAEWQTLINFADNTPGLAPQTSTTAGRKLKSVTGWNPYSGITATDQYGFTALPGGLGNPGGGSFGFVGGYGYWWTATELGSATAYFRYMYYYNDSASLDYNDKTALFSVRLVQD